MTPYFTTHERTARLHAAVDAWKGTPFHPYANLRGAGVDCVNLAAALLKESGLAASVFLPRYSIEGGLHQDRKLLVEFLAAHPAFAPVTVLPLSTEQTKGCCGEIALAPPRACLIPGDVLCFNLRRREHVGIYLGMEEAQFAHVFVKNPVTTNSLNDPSWGNILTAAFRPLEVPHG